MHVVHFMNFKKFCRHRLRTLAITVKSVFLLAISISCINVCFCVIHFLCSSRHFLIPWTGGAFAPLGPFLCPTTEEKKMAYCPKDGP